MSRVGHCKIRCSAVSSAPLQWGHEAESVSPKSIYLPPYPGGMVG